MRPTEDNRECQSKTAAAIEEAAYAASGILLVGHNRRFGRYVRVRDGFGDTFTYGGLASVSAWYPTLKGRPSAAASCAPV